MKWLSRIFNSICRPREIKVIAEEDEYGTENKKADGEPSGTGSPVCDTRISMTHGKLSRFDKSQAAVCFKSQYILRDVEPALVDKLFKSGKLRDFKKDEKIATQGDNGDAAFFILCGLIGVVVNGRRIAERKANECVGEMSMLDPTRKRSADLVAMEDTTVLRVPVKKWIEILDEHHRKSPLIFNMAVVLAERLRERSRFHSPPNTRPRIFIGSSTEAVDVAKDLKSVIKGKLFADVVDWTDPIVFKLSLGNMESLELLASTCDFAIMVLSGDDRLSCRGDTFDAPRDNVIFELGFFMGVLGRTRAFFLVNGAKIPSDLSGMTYLTYTIRKRMVDFGEALMKIRTAIQSQGVR